MEIFALFPIFLMLIVYVAVIGLTIWFAITFLHRQKERNLILKEISNKLSHVEIKKKDEEVS